ncbi:MAG: hypothetical protein ABI481_02445 [Pyrinomonadaceae bacterium]
MFRLFLLMLVLFVFSLPAFAQTETVDNKAIIKETGGENCFSSPD